MSVLGREWVFECNAPCSRWTYIDMAGEKWTVRYFDTLTWGDQCGYSWLRSTFSLFHYFGGCLIFSSRICERCSHQAESHSKHQGVTWFKKVQHCERTVGFPFHHLFPLLNRTACLRSSCHRSI